MTLSISKHKELRDALGKVAAGENLDELKESILSAAAQAYSAIDSVVIVRESKNAVVYRIVSVATVKVTKRDGTIVISDGGVVA